MIHNLDAVTFLTEKVRPDSATLIWTDPPFGTGEIQAQRGVAYSDPQAAIALSMMDRIADYLYRSLSSDGTMAILLDHRIVHDTYVIMRDVGFVPEGEIIWTFGLGGTSRSWWTNKHNTILLFSKGDPKWHPEHVPLVPRKAPVGKGKYSGDTKPANSVWDYTFPQTHAERVGYPNQKPLRVVEPFVLCHTDPRDLCIDPFGGSGSLMHAAVKNGRRFATTDTNPEAVRTIRERYASVRPGFGQ